VKEEEMPWNRTLYPPNWETIRACMLARAQNRCEGSPRYPDGRAQNHAPHPITGAYVVLTVAHWPDPDPQAVSPAGLFAWCQRCHNTMDAPMRARHAAQTRRRAREVLGQMALACMED
jgi:hypothetical protein